MGRRGREEGVGARRLEGSTLGVQTLTGSGGPVVLVPDPKDAGMHQGE